MSYHHCPIEPSDWSHGNGDDSCTEVCPKCRSEEVDNPETNVWKCTECDWTGPEPAYREPEPFDPD